MASQHVRVYMRTLQHSDHTATHRNTLQHIATRIPLERLAIGRLSSKPIGSGGVSMTCQAPVAVLWCVAVCCRALQRVAAEVRQ